MWKREFHSFELTPHNKQACQRSQVHVTARSILAFVRAPLDHPNMHACGLLVHSPLGGRPGLSVDLPKGSMTFYDMESSLSESSL